MPEPFTIRMFLPDGDPDGVRIIDRLNWTGIAIYFPRRLWSRAKIRAELSRPGIYILVGYDESSQLPQIYIGQGDSIGGRIASHDQSKEFWDWGIAFASTNNGLNRGHITWLEHALIERAKVVRRCCLHNSQAPTEPALSESEKADTRSFLHEVLRILPLVGLHAFEVAEAIKPEKLQAESGTEAGTVARDTIVVPAHEDGFQKVFLGENCWYAIRISGGMLQKIRYIAAYRTAPISAITHYAEVDHMEPYGEDGKYKVVFKGAAKPLEHAIPFGNATKGFMQGSRYTSLARLREAKSLPELFN